MTRKQPIAYYAHHMGSGHSVRGRQVLRGLNRPAALMTSYNIRKTHHDPFDLIRLDTDHAEETDYEQSLSPKPDCLHHAPLNVAGVQNRMASIANWIQWNRPTLFVSDVSMELLQFARLCSVPTLGVRLTGPREDLAHRQGFDGCRRVVFPMPEIFEDPATSNAVRQKTEYVGGLCRHFGKSLSRAAARERFRVPSDRPVVVVTNGAYGAGRDSDYLLQLARSQPNYYWIVLGKVVGTLEASPENLRFAGQVPDTYPWLRAADVVVGSCGCNTMLEAAYAVRPYVCLPEDRPYAEQSTKAEVLERHGLAVVRYETPDLSEWTALLDRARGLNAYNFAKIADPQSVTRYRNLIHTLADEWISPQFRGANLTARKAVVV